jgi:hypothetical protein
MSTSEPTCTPAMSVSSTRADTSPALERKETRLVDAAIVPTPHPDTGFYFQLRFS